MKNRRLAAILLVTLLTLGAAELALRAYDHYYPSFIFYKPNYNPFRGLPHSTLFGFQLNSGGFHDVEFAPKREGTFRILALGDSFAFGVVPYPDNYLTLLEENLKTKGHEVEILNMGVPQTGPQDYVNLLIEEGLPLEPDLILVSLFMGNDFVGLTATDRPPTLRTSSYLVSLFNYAFSIRPFLSEATNYGAEGNDYDDNAPAFTREKFLEIERGQLGVFLQAGQRDHTPAFETSFTKLKVPLETLKRLSEREGATIAFTLIPDAIQVYGTLQKDVEHTFGTRVAQYDLTHPNAALTEWLGKMEIASLDLTNAFKEVGTPGVALYKPNDIHWNIAGNRLASEIIEKFLVESELLPKS